MKSNNFEKIAGHVGIPVRKLPAETMAIINDAPQGQNRTSNYKKAVKIFEDLVFKGPFTWDDKKLKNNLNSLMFQLILINQIFEFLFFY